MKPEPIAPYASEEEPPVRKGGPFRILIEDFFESRIAASGLLVITLIMVLALFAPWITPQNPYDLRQLSIIDGNLAPGTQGMTGTTFWLGTDPQGRDILSAIVYGLRMSLIVAGLATLGALCVGLTAGIAAAYFGGRIDSLIMRVVDIQLSFPAILIALILLAIFGRGIDKVVLALILVHWAYYARTVRGSALVERRRDYIEAARGLTIPHYRIMFVHLLPNCLPALLVVATVLIAQAIALEATLSFLGVGVPITEPSLGLLIANGYDYLLSGRYWISTFPGIALVVTIVAINLVGDQLRDILNPRLRR